MVGGGTNGGTDRDADEDGDSAMESLYFIILYYNRDDM